jgi:uncharacterized protein
LRAFILLFALLIAAPAAAQDVPALSGRVVDQADLLSPAEEAYLTDRLAALEARTTDQLVIATVPSLGGRTIQAYAQDLFNRWRLGQAGHDNGVLLLVAPGEHQVRIEVGRGLGLIMTDLRAKAIIDADMIPEFRQSRWYEGVRAGTRSIVATLVAHEREPRRRQP